MRAGRDVVGRGLSEQTDDAEVEEVVGAIVRHFQYFRPTWFEWGYGLMIWMRYGWLEALAMEAPILECSCGMRKGFAKKLWFGPKSNVGEAP